MMRGAIRGAGFPRALIAAATVEGIAVVVLAVVIVVIARRKPT